MLDQQNSDSHDKIVHKQSHLGKCCLSRGVHTLKYSYPTTCIKQFVLFVKRCSYFNP